MKYEPYKHMVGGFSANDGTIDFYLRVASLVDEGSVVLDLGAGRAAWFEDDRCKTRRDARTLRGKVAKVIAADVDEAVLENRASDEQVLIRDGKLDLPESSVDLIVADYVLEHIEDAEGFARQVQTLLKPGGWFCARTPHKYSYLAVVSRLVQNANHVSVLKHVQPDRKEVDVFPALYRMNTRKDVAAAFPGWEDHTLVFKPDPGYFFGSKAIYLVQNFLHRFLWAEASGNLFVFVRKPGGDAA